MKSKELITELKNFTLIRDHIEDLLGERDTDERTKLETLLIFEALYNDMLDKGIPGDTLVKVWRIKLFGDVRIKIGFEGDPYVPASAALDDNSGKEESVEDRVISAFAEKIESRYHNGRNHLILTARRSTLRHAKLNLLALVLALLTYFPIVSLAGKTGQQEIVNKIVFYIEKLFTDAILSVGAPVTFFSLLRNLTGMFITAEGNSLMRRLEIKAILTSVFAIILACLTCYINQFPFAFMYFFIGDAFGGGDPPLRNLHVDVNVMNIIDSIVDPSFFDTFGSFAPFPLIVLAILTTYALCSSGSYFDSIRRVIDGCYVLFSKMLAAVMYTMPFFAYMAMLDVLLNAGRHTTIFLLCLTIFVPFSMITMILFYLLRLIRAGINPLSFFKKLMPLLLENLRINSTSDAVPFNTRYCVTKLGLDRNRLNESLPALARLNLDGNCYLISVIATMFIFMSGNGVTAFDTVMMGVIILFLSLGAPDQPGSILIGLLVIINYFDVTDAVALAIYAESIFGGLLTMINASGDIITVAIDDKREKKKRTEH